MRHRHRDGVTERRSIEAVDDIDVAGDCVERQRTLPKLAA